MDFHSISTPQHISYTAKHRVGSVRAHQPFSFSWQAGPRAAPRCAPPHYPRAPSQLASELAGWPVGRRNIAAARSVQATIAAVRSVRTVIAAARSVQAAIARLLLLEMSGWPLHGYK